MLEGVFEIRKQSDFVDELGGLQVVESATERLVRQLGDRLQQRERNVLADDGGGLAERLRRVTKAEIRACEREALCRKP